MSKPFNFTTPAQIKSQIKAAKAAEKKYKAHLALLRKLEAANDACNAAQDALNAHPTMVAYAEQESRYYERRAREQGLPTWEPTETVDLDA